MVKEKELLTEFFETLGKNRKKACYGYGDVKIALENKNSEYLLAEFILQKLNEKLYWRNKYKKA